MLRLLPALAAFLATDLEAVVSRKKRDAALYAVICLLGLSAWMMVLLALAAWLSTGVGLPLAFASVAFASLLLAGFVAVALAVLHRMDRRRLRERKPAQTMMAATALALAPSVVRSRGALAALAIGAAVYAATRYAGATDDRTGSR